MVSRVGKLVFCLWLANCSSAAVGQFDPHAPAPIRPFRGSLLLHGGGDVALEIREEFVKLAGGDQARIAVLAPAEASDPEIAEELPAWREAGATKVELLCATSPEQAAQPEFVERLKSATGVWFPHGRRRLREVYLQAAIESPLQELLDRGGAVGGTGSGAALCAAISPTGDARREAAPSGETPPPGPTLRQLDRRGLDLLPGAILDTRLLVRDRRARLEECVARNSGRVGLGLDDQTAIIVRGRSLRVIGHSVAGLYLAGSASRKPRYEEWKAGHRADYLALSRAAQARCAPAFPAEPPAIPEVSPGRLVIVGGGGMPANLMRKFVGFAGGESARIVYIPCSEDEKLDVPVGVLRSFQRAGAREVTWLHTKDRRLANDEQFLAPLRDATGIWFGGGRQWNLVDSYQNTRAHQLMHEVLARGGVIGGSSAGASIQGDYMPRGDPLGNLVMMAEGYERGLGFLTGVAIDQHFRQRNRFRDMTRLMQTYPQLLGIGIDEATALVVEGSVGQVEGQGQVAFYDYRGSASPQMPDYLSLPAGGRFDLVKRERIPE